MFRKGGCAPTAARGIAPEMRCTTFARGTPWAVPLLAQAELFDQRAVGIGVARLEVVQQLAPPRDHAEQAAAGVMILDVTLEVVGKAIDARGQKRDLHFRRTRVALGPLVIGDYFRLVGNRDGHCVDPYLLSTLGKTAIIAS